MLRKIVNLNFASRRCFQSTASTIFALSTNIKSSGSAIAVIRVAGPSTVSVIDRFTRGNSCRFVENPRRAIVHGLYDNNELIDRAMMLWFPGPNSYTGEDMCEFHLHGSQAVISRMMRTLFTIDGCRPAKEGEFTRRALINGKVGLIEAEAIGDLIKARTDLQRKHAISALNGGAESGMLDRWRREVIKNMAHLEAFIDFGEDELIDSSVITDFNTNVRKLCEEIEHHLNTSARRSDLIKDGVQVAIIGEANVGKSSLMNRLCQRDLSIVSPISGTTRDVVQAHLDFAGYSLSVADTAGIKRISADSTTIDIVEQEGIRRALQHAQNAHLVIVVLDGTNLEDESHSFSNEVREALQNRSPEEVVYVVNKCDLMTTPESRQKVQQFIDSEMKPGQSKSWRMVSCNTNEGIEELVTSLEEKVEELCGQSETTSMFYCNERHVMHLQKAAELLRTVKTTGDLAVAAATLRQAAHQLGCLTGNITTDDVLDVIFRDFCIGK